MKNLRLLRKTMGILLILGLISGCVSQSGGIDAKETQCCLTKGDLSYDVANVDVPQFMVDMVEVSLHAAMQTLGYSHRRENPADLYIHAVYEQVDHELGTHEEPRLGERTMMVEPAQFVARINIEIKNGAGDTVWQGHVQRLHSVGPGEYMHRGHAANSIANALVELIAADRP